MHANEVETKENLKFPEIYTRSAWVQIALFADDSKLFRPVDSVISAVLPGALIMAKNSTTPNVKS